MSGVVEFLLARLDEDEAAAIGAQAHPAEGPAERWKREGPSRDIAGRRAVLRSDHTAHMQPVAQLASGSAAAHIARHDPARVLADVAAKRRIVEAGRSECLSHGATREDHCDGCQSAASVNAEMDWVVRTLATAYSSHPDYDKNWRP